jgi:integrase
VFTLSYNQLQRGLRKCFSLLGVGGHWSSHGFRRGGATALLQSGVPLPTIAVLGRWQSERSMREYLRLGELSILKMEQSLQPEVNRRILALSRCAEACWLPTG